MVSLNIFRADAFSTLELTAAVERNPYVPAGLAELNIFDPFPIRTTDLMVEERAGQLTLIPFSERGGPGQQRTTERRKARTFSVPRLLKEDTLYAHELQNIRAFGQVSELMQVQDEVARRLAGPTGLMPSLAYTKEFHRLAAIQGLALDSDGSVYYNFFDEFGIAQAAEVDFDLESKTEYSLRPLCNGIVRTMARKAQGAFTPATQIYGLCGDQFWDDLVTHPDVVKTYYNWQAAAELRQGNAFEAMYFGGIYFFNYRGSDDATEIAVASNKVKFFPVGAPGVFQQALAPGESFEWVNTPGKEQYVVPVFDRDENAWWKAKLYAYPLHICTRPEVLLSGKTR